MCTTVFPDCKLPESEDSFVESDSFNTYLPDGCLYCQNGSKMVLFLTGICGRDCFFCPVSDERREIDCTFANERKVFSDEDVIEEAISMAAEGTGITGGEPLLFPERVIHYIELLKSDFGSDHHIHMYTSLAPDSDLLEKLKSAGLDEIRFHPPQDLWEKLDLTDYKSSIEFA